MIAPSSEPFSSPCATSKTPPIHDINELVMSRPIPLPSIELVVSPRKPLSKILPCSSLGIPGRQRRTGTPKTGHFLMHASRKNDHVRRHIFVTPPSVEVACSKWRLKIMAIFHTIIFSHFSPLPHVFSSPNIDYFFLHLYVEILSISHRFSQSPLGGIFHPYFVVILITIFCPDPSFYYNRLHLTMATNCLTILHFTLSLYCNSFHLTFAGLG